MTLVHFLKKSMLKYTATFTPNLTFNLMARKTLHICNVLFINNSLRLSVSSDN